MDRQIGDVLDVDAEWAVEQARRICFRIRRSVLTRSRRRAAHRVSLRAG
jgi:hypothetical protein